MPPRSSRAPAADPPELSHRDIIRSVESLRQQVGEGFTALNVRADERHNATNARLDRIEERLDKHTRAIGQLEGDLQDSSPALRAVAGGEPPDPNEGVSFKRGWKSWIAVGALIVALVGGIASALEHVGNLALNVAHMFNPPAGH